MLWQRACSFAATLAAPCPARPSPGGPRDAEAAPPRPWGGKKGHFRPAPPRLPRPLAAAPPARCDSPLGLPPPAEFARVINRLQKSVVQIHCAFADSLAEAQFLGTGFIWDAGGAVVSAAHLFHTPDETPRYFFARLADDRWFRLRPVGVSADADVAVLEIEGAGEETFSAAGAAGGGGMMSSAPAVSPCGEAASARGEAAFTPPPPFVDRDALHLGQPVFTVGGSQFSDEPMALVGSVSQPRQSFRNLKIGLRCRFIQLAIIVLPGFSGAPVCDVEGRLIGMITKKFEDYALALPMKQLSAVVAQLRATGSWATPTLGLVLRQRVPALAAERPASPGAALAATGLYVQNVRPGSPAENAGVRADDVLVALDGVPLTSQSQLFESVALIEGRPLSLTLVRDESLEITVSVTPLRADLVKKPEKPAPEAPLIEGSLFKFKT